MALPTPPYISSAKIAVSDIRYKWDEWNVNDYFLEVDEDQYERLDSLSDAANLALAIGSGEWICHRFSLLSNDMDPYHFIEAAWAAIVHPNYCLDIETDDDEWRGPIRGPLNIMMSILHDGIHRRETDPEEATRACWMYNLAKHVLPQSAEFENWFGACVLRLEKHNPWIENADIWDEGPPLGIPVPREALNPDVAFDPNNAPEMLDRFLRSLKPVLNPFLAEPDELLETPGFKGAPYQYSVSDWNE